MADIKPTPIPVHTKIINEEGKPTQALVRYLAALEKIRDGQEKRIGQLENP